MTPDLWVHLRPGDIASLDREGVDSLAEELWVQRAANCPWDAALASHREAYRAFAMLALVELREIGSNPLEA
jgi:hypothetical protein